ncbi:uncharacterized protein AMSG_05077 [Thecamonas trahens ATCC 50062]|uniref:Uncharacterized protein n=1 Tax=Thecamonas trahens ATCC 50062 TaxID=461836 RepID=A0A0L0DCS3_THETB|nr:hypothetical protein AMSG_05077 [Thecamonas trahens ATCC 50062]KNC49108.1 hypothetical protein AMSG_05077 [Thecamonas trahens ATCC 50062]|eukprot:XP_013758136.1 hypothetical protein AMSG_05077 [Thecamonas trahens ATCC 50062]
MGVGWVQFQAHLWKNLRLMSKSWKAAVATTVLVPLVCVLVVAVAQSIGSSSEGAAPSGSRDAFDLGPIPLCTPQPSCLSLAYTPGKHPVFVALAEEIARASALPASTVRAFETRGEMESFVLGNPNTTSLAIEFVPEALPDLQYVVWYNASLESEAAGCFAASGLVDVRCAGTVPRMRVQAMAAVMAAALNVSAASANMLGRPMSADGRLALELSVRPLTVPPSRDETAASVFLALMCGIYLAGALVASVVLVVLVGEKASGSRAMMYIHGLHNWVYWLTWGLVFEAGAVTAAGVVAGTGQLAGFRLFTCSGPGLMFVVAAEFSPSWSRSARRSRSWSARWRWQSASRWRSPFRALFLSSSSAQLTCTCCGPARARPRSGLCSSFRRSSWSRSGPTSTLAALRSMRPIATRRRALRGATSRRHRSTDRRSVSMCGRRRSRWESWRQWRLASVSSPGLSTRGSDSAMLSSAADRRTTSRRRPRPCQRPRCSACTPPPRRPSRRRRAQARATPRRAARAPGRIRTSKPRSHRCWSSTMAEWGRPPASLFSHSKSTRCARATGQRQRCATFRLASRRAPCSACSARTAPAKLRFSTC